MIGVPRILVRHEKWTHLQERLVHAQELLRRLSRAAALNNKVGIEPLDFDGHLNSAPLLPSRAGANSRTEQACAQTSPSSSTDACCCTGSTSKSCSFSHELGHGEYSSIISDSHHTIIDPFATLYSHDLPYPSTSHAMRNQISSCIDIFHMHRHPWIWVRRRIPQ